MAAKLKETAKLKSVNISVNHDGDVSSIQDVLNYQKQFNVPSNATVFSDSGNVTFSWDGDDA